LNRRSFFRIIRKISIVLAALSLGLIYALVTLAVPTFLVTTFLEWFCYNRVLVFREFRKEGRYLLYHYRVLEQKDKYRYVDTGTGTCLNCCEKQEE
jgi:hypothetical protein